MVGKNNLLLDDMVVNIDDLQYLSLQELIGIITHLNLRLRDVMQGTEWLTNEDKRLENKAIDTENILK